ncbi:MAG TPA: ParB N-terminal domain-containing protein [Pseudonocardia sp.]
MTTTESTTADITETASGEIESIEAVPELGELLMVDPASLRIGANTRRDVVLDPHFCRDISDRGVREPIIVRRDGEGVLSVLKGQRRTLAACRARLPLVRVLIESAPEAGEDDTAGQVERIVDQYGENFHRAPISQADEAHAHQQLLDLGLTAGQVARRTHTPTKRVRAISAVNRSDRAREALASYPLTIDQAAVIAELDDGTEAGQEAAALLCESAASEPEQFGHHAQRLRDDRAERDLIASHVRALTEQGITVLNTEQIVDATELYRLRPTPGDPSGTQLRPEEHSSCPGHAVYVTVRRGWRNEPPEVRTECYCTDPHTHGHAPRYDTAEAGGRDVATGELTEEQKTERRAARAQVITNNKLWDSSTTHRRTWVAEFLARKKPPADAAAFIAATLVSGSHDVRKAMESGHPTACALLGLPEPAPLYSSGPRPLVELAKTATGVRATQLSLAVLLGAYEDGTSRNSWRSPTPETVAYFTALRDWHYPLSEVERLVLEPDTDSRGGDEAEPAGGHDDDGDDDGAVSGDDPEPGVEVEPDSGPELEQTLNEEPPQ